MLEQSLPCISFVERDNTTFNIEGSLEEKMYSTHRSEAQKHRRVTTWGCEGPIPEEFQSSSPPEEQIVDTNQRNQKKSGYSFYLKQTEALFMKSFHFQRRQRVELFLNILAPLIILAVLYGISKLADSIMHDTAVKYEAKDVGYFIPQFRNPYYVG